MFNYKKYFSQIRPRTKMQMYNRFLFSFCSVHTTWERNVIGFNMLKNKYHTDIRSLKPLIKKSGMGLTNNRARFIKAFTLDYQDNWKEFKKQPNEEWVGYSNRLQKRILGLGFAKTRFAIELMYPNIAQVCCVDTHVIQLHKQNPNKMNKRLYERIEYGHLQRAKKKNINPIELRWLFWDNKQNQDGPRYWSSCLEDEKTKSMYDM